MVELERNAEDAIVGRVDSAMRSHVVWLMAPQLNIDAMSSRMALYGDRLRASNGSPFRSRTRCPWLMVPSTGECEGLLERLSAERETR